MAEPSIHVSVEGYLDLTSKDVWLDGDQPEQITAEAVAKVMREEGSVRGLLDSWGMDAFLRVEVTVHEPNPAHGQAEALLPEHAPDRWTVTTAEVWD